jgi:hypothetical protein
MSLTDTSPEALAVQIAAYRAMGPEARAELAVRMGEEAREIALAVSRGLARSAIDAAVTAAPFLRRLVVLLDAAGIPYMVTGSLASAFHGTPRTTRTSTSSSIQTRERSRPSSRRSGARASMPTMAPPALP